MELKYQDNSLMASYVQIYLKEYYGLSVHKVVKRNQIDPDTYELTVSDPIKLTGDFNEQTYSSVAMFMLRNYPNEMYPGLWYKEESGEWVYSTSIYNPFIVETDSSDGQHILRKDIVIPSSQEDLFIKVIASNMENLPYNPKSITVPRRVLSYLLNEVVSPLSTPEEIIRVKQYLKNISFDSYYIGQNSNYIDDIAFITSQINSYLGSNITYIYDDTFKNIIWQLQNLFIKGHQDEMSAQFMDFKATGYVDPWTEHILKGGSEDEYATG